MTLRNRRELLRFAALAPALPYFTMQRAFGASRAGELGRHDGRVVVVIRMRGGNDGLNTVVPVRDDRYYAARPNIAIARRDTLALQGGELGLHPSLADFKHLVDEGLAGIAQSVGYPGSSRSHARATEIWESASLSEAAPTTGWLGRYLEAGCDCAALPAAGLEFGDTAGLTLASESAQSRLVGRPSLLTAMDADSMLRTAAEGPASTAFAELANAQHELADIARLVERARRGSGRRYGYPDTDFGRAVRWTGDMIETECPTRAYYLTVGSFAEGAASFDTHIEQLPQHRSLYAELGAGLRAFAEHLQRARHFERVLFLTFSDFGRQLPENRTRGTEHGDASVLLYGGGAVVPGIRGPMPDLGRVHDGGVPYGIDFRAVYADVLTRWLGAPAGLLPDSAEPLRIVDAV